MSLEFSKANSYLINRLESLREEKIIIDTKMKKIEYEINVISEKIQEMSENVDITYEIFSPRMKETSFSREEIEMLKIRRGELEKLHAEYEEQLSMVDEDIELIVDALKEFRPEITFSDDKYITGSPVNDEDANREEDIIYGIKILEKQEFERNRIARDLYDNSIQVLNNLVHKCDVCSKIIEKDPIRARLEIETMSKSLREAIDEMNGIIHNLRPMSIDNANLEETIRRFIESIKKDFNINIDFAVKGESVELPMTVKSTFIRIVKEAVNNALKHSECKNIFISIFYDFDKISIIVEDDGRGFSVEEVKNSDKPCFGLSMLQERVLLLAGTVSIDSTIDKGTRIQVDVPIE